MGFTKFFKFDQKEFGFNVYIQFLKSEQISIS